MESAVEKTMPVAVPKDISGQFMNAYEKWAESLFRYAYFRVNSRELAQDIVSQAFLNTWKYVQRGETVHQWRLFLFRTTRNLIFDYYRIKKNESVFLSDVIKETFISEKISPQKQTDRLEARLIVEQFAKLDPVQAEIIQLKFIEGLSAQEISGIVGKSRNAVYVDIHRALKKLKNRFEK